jgi:hypothetical protein
MRTAFVVAFCVAALTLTVASAQQAQSEFKNCTEAYWACLSRTQMKAECAMERQWCLQTGTFADPKSKAVTTGLQRR